MSSLTKKALSSFPFICFLSLFFPPISNILLLTEKSPTSL